MEFVPELCFRSLKKFISILWCKEFLVKTTGFIWELRLLRFQWPRYHDRPTLLSAWGKGFSLPLHAWGCQPVSPAQIQPSPQGRGRRFSLKQSEITYKREILWKNHAIGDCYTVILVWTGQGTSEIRSLRRTTKSEFSVWGKWDREE